MKDLAALRAHFRSQKSSLLQSLASRGTSSTRGVRATLGSLSQLADGTLRALWQEAGFPPCFALAAVGGFGRRELFPYSDVDVLLLVPHDQSPEHDDQVRTRIERFIGNCWDVGLEIGSSVRTVEQCCDEAAADVTIQTSLLEARLVTGSIALFAGFQEKFFAALDPQAFFVAKTLELQQRHSKFEDTPYALEPNCKESPGGLRDLQVILWVAKAAGFGSNWDALARNGLATAFEVKQIRHNEALLRLIRARLHLIAQRREDRLVFDLQTAVAQTFGYGDAPTPGADARPDRAEPDASPAGAAPAKPVFIRPSEALMRRYYWAAKAVTQLNQILLLNIEERLNPSTHIPRPINARFCDKAGMVEVASDDLYQREPHAILETFLVYQTTAGVKGLSARTLRALFNARKLMGGKFRTDPVNRETFRKIMMQHDGITHAMRLMNQTSVLGRYL
ncbi:MAG: bifunctional uridylyltransferase/uridylyl-removing protein, partial [Rhodoferax sp.]